MVTSMYPSVERPHYDTFVKSQIESIAARGHEVSVFYIEGFRSPFEYLRAVPLSRRMVQEGGFDIDAPDTRGTMFD